MSVKAAAATEMYAVSVHAALRSSKVRSVLVRPSGASNVGDDEVGSLNVTAGPPVWAQS